MRGDIRIVNGELEALPEVPESIHARSEEFQYIYKTFKELIEDEGMNQLFRGFYAIVGVPIAIIDLEANVLASSKWNPICTDFHRVNADSCAKCLESDMSLANQLNDGKEFNIYRCKNGMTDSASPIVIENKHVANLFVGQYLLEKPDEDFFIHQAAKYGYSTDAYLKALHNTPILSQEKSEVILDFLVRFAKLFAVLGMDRLREKDALKQLKELNENLEKKVEERTKEKDSLLALFDRGDSVLFKWNNDATWSVKYVSDNAIKLLEYNKEEFLRKDIIYADCIHKDDLAQVTQEVEDAVKKDVDFLKHEPYRIITKSGTIKWVMDYTVTEKDDEGNIVYFIGYISDITDQKEKEKIIREKLQRVIDTQNSIVILTDSKKVKYANKTFLNFFGYATLDEFRNAFNCISDLFVNQEHFFHLGMMKKNETNWIESLMHLNGRQRVVSLLNAKGLPHAFQVSINNYDNDDYIVSFSDISDSMVEKLELKKEITIDNLTQVYNRVYFQKYIDEILLSYKYHNLYTGILFFDIDYFKKFNDTYGHDAGDYVLKNVASLVKHSIRESDKLIRWGGEEFVVIAGVAKKELLYQMAEHVRSAIEAHQFKNFGSVTCSFGCVIHGENETILETINKADEKLYMAKANGRNRVEF